MFAEAVFKVMGLVQLMHVIGPIMGGLVNSSVGMSKTCLSMGYVGAGSILLYLVFALFVYCTLHTENNISLNLHTNDDEDNINDITIGHQPNSNPSVTPAGTSAQRIF